MPELIYPWKRFWYPRGGQISLADDGFLLDPASEYAKYHASDAVSFESINDTQCMVLLGEPGIGKSITLKAEFEGVRKAVSGRGDTALWFDLRDYSSDDRLERQVFKCAAIQEWRSGQHSLHLFLDSLDEALLRIDNISRVLVSELEELPAERLRLRIASRPADWQATLEEGLVKIWRANNVGVFELAPLRKVDVACAAEISQINAEPFIETVIQRDVVPLAIKPVTLEFLIGVFAKGGDLQANRSKLYADGLNLLCTEDNKYRKDSLKGRAKLTPNQRLAIAARIAAVTQFSNRSAIWFGASTGLEPEDVPIESIVGGTEGEGASRVAVVDLAALREVLDTGLFSSRGLSRQGWRHQTYAEYLSAYYLDTHEVPPERLRPLIMHPDGSGKVISQLRETAAWLAGMNAAVFELVVRTDAEVLLRGNMVAAGHVDRARVAKQLLEAFESGDVTQSLWDIRQHFDRLDNPELANIVQPYICDASRQREARIAAIEIIRACRLTNVLGQVAAIALDPNENARIRDHAAATVVALGDANARTALLPLALGLTGEDPQDDLKGYGLSAVWPQHITAQDLFSALTPIKDQNYFGEYRRFLGSGIAVQVESHDIETAVRGLGSM